MESCISAYEIHHKNALVTFTPMVTGDPNYHSSPGKESMNLMALISELYNFQVISCVLIYDLIRDLLVGEVTELNVELLLKITRSEFTLLILTVSRMLEHSACPRLWPTTATG